MEQNRLKSWAVWLSIAGAVWVILCAFGLNVRWGISETAWNDVLNAIGTVLIAFGVLNNPTNKLKF